MSTPRIYVDDKLSNGISIALTGSAARHVGKVLRLRTGDAVILFDGTGTDYPAVIQEAGRNEVIVVCGDGTAGAIESPLHTEVWQSIGKGQKMDSVIQKATELGVNRIQPLYTRYGVVKLTPDRAEKKLRHWQEVAISACEQCGRSIVPEVLPPLPYAAALASLNGQQRALVLSPRASQSFGDAVQPDKSQVLVIGPEGGFSDEEIALSEEHGVVPVRLGERILRTETAPVAALGILQYLAGDLQ